MHQLLIPLLLSLTLMQGLLLAANPGHGRAKWLAESSKLEPGSQLLTVVELTVDPGWHVYWINPGDAGMPTTVTWELPEGFSCGPLVHPWPTSFTTGELQGYGHEGRVRYPVVVTVPKDFRQQAVLRGTLSWLACNDDSCVPGSADLELTLGPGRLTPGPDAGAVAAAHATAVTSAPEGMKLKVRDGGDAWVMEITGEQQDAALKARAMVATPELCKPGEPIQFRTRADMAVLAKVPKSEYAPDMPELVQLWLWPEGWKRPLLLEGKPGRRK